MKTLDHTISCGVVGGGAKAANPETAAELAEERDSNCAPRSVVRVAGTPKLAIHWSMKAWTTVEACMSAIGTAIGQREKRSTQVSK